jgi:hypothetical protein
MREQEQETQRPWLHPFSIIVVSITQKIREQLNRSVGPTAFFWKTAEKYSTTAKTIHN